MRHAGCGERAAGRELVVRRDERSRPVEDSDAGALEPCELLEPDLDPVEVLRDVEARDRDVASLERAKGFSRGKDA
jgi:hypothetical protein